MNKIINTGSKRWYVWVSLLASVIAVLVFITGKNLPDFFPSKTQIAPASTALPENPVIDYFPLFVGSSRVYSVGMSTPKTEGGSELVESTGTYTEKVIMVESSAYEKLHIYKIEQTGEVFDLDCTGLEPTIGTVNKWYITDENNLYVGCSEEAKNKIASALYAQYFLNTPATETQSLLPKITFPLKIDSQWRAFYDMPLAPDGNKDYTWYVESNESIETAAGKFNECFKIVLYTLPDTSFKYVCKGVGVVALEYHHNGSPYKYRVELASYSLTGQP
jgi:hypothetical protein